LTTLVNEVPENGSNDQVLKKFGSGFNQYQWETILEVPSGGSTGQVLTKTAGGYAWQAPQTGGAQVQIYTTIRTTSYTYSYTVPSGMFAHMFGQYSPGGNKTIIGAIGASQPVVGNGDLPAGTVIGKSVGVMQVDGKLNQVGVQYVYITIFRNS
jgi:hypothetical protein